MNPLSEKAEKEEGNKYIYVSKYGLEALKDIAFIVTLFTGLSYFITFAYKIGFLNYYQLGDIFTIEITASDLSLIFSRLIVYITVAGFLYFIISSILVLTDTINDFLINPIAITISVFSAVSLLYSGKVNFVKLLIIIILISVYIIFKRITKLNKFEQIPLISKIYNKFNNKKSNLYSKWNAAGIIKFLIIGLILTLFFEAFFNLGTREAEEKENYIIIKQKNLVYVLIAEKNDTFIFAPVQIKKRIIEPNYLFIEGRSDFENPFKLERIRIKGGLKVKK